ESDVSGGPQGSGDGFFQKAQAWKERIDSIATKKGSAFNAQLDVEIRARQWRRDK
ncbi:unnamed protein product, partial [Effrenium voratum]